MGLLTYIYIYIIIYICISYIPGASALPDIYARCAREGECVYIRQGTRAWDITNMLHFLHFALFNLPSQIKHSLCLYSWGYYL